MDSKLIDVLDDIIELAEEDLRISCLNFKNNIDRYKPENINLPHFYQCIKSHVYKGENEKLDKLCKELKTLCI